VPLGELANETVDPADVVVGDELTMGVDHVVVPGGNHLAGVGLGGVPRGRHIGVGDRHDQQCPTRRQSPQRVRPGHVTANAHASVVLIDQHGDGRGLESVGRDRHQMRQGRAIDHRQEDAGVVLGKRGRPVHDAQRTVGLDG
jgi:hypothetical protein